MSFTLTLQYHDSEEGIMIEHRQTLPTKFMETSQGALIRALKSLHTELRLEYPAIQNLIGDVPHP